MREDLLVVGAGGYGRPTSDVRNGSRAVACPSKVGAALRVRTLVGHDLWVQATGAT
jgi:hypothetical protein